MEDLEELDDFDEPEEELPFLIYFFAAYPVFPLYFTLYQLPLVESIVTFVPFLSVVITFASPEALLRTLSELAVTVPKLSASEEAAKNRHSNSTASTAPAHLRISFAFFPKLTLRRVSGKHFITNLLQSQ